MYPQKRESKYGNVKKEFGGRTFHSKKEADYAQELQLLKHAKKIKDWIPQFRLPLKVNGKLITNYRVDFKVIMPNGKEELHEVKGFATPVWKLKWKLCQALYGRKYKMIVI